ncbi:MAG TPA: flagellar motor protein MotB [Candidatus Baltobacteraceae bacterium]|nr:flagellar motor protein MotB [Candidatus Baltobacteraceae bacterium]
MRKREQHHGGAWKTAYADFVTAMMALFLLLWLTAQDKKIKEAVERAFRNPFSAVNKESTGIIPSKDTSQQNKQKGSFDSVTAVEMQMLRKITEDLAKMLAQSQELEQSVQIELTPDGVRINIFDHSQKPIFEPGTDKFTTYGDWVFSTLAWEISRYQTFHIELEGHTETRPDADPENLTKWDLSTERANAARRKLIESGVKSDQVYKVSGFADTQPLPGLDPTVESNRRVTVLLKVESADQPASAAQDQNPP